MKRFALMPVSIEIRGWCLILEQEMMRWAGVKMNHIFWHAGVLPSKSHVRDASRSAQPWQLNRDFLSSSPQRVN
jgi:hypothetical protein